MNEKTCKNCDHWEKADEECHRYPPHEDEEGVSGWSFAKASDHCGEFVARRTETMENDINTRLSAVESTLAGVVQTANENTDRLVSAVNASSEAQKDALMRVARPDAAEQREQERHSRAMREPGHVERIRCAVAFEALKAWLPKMTFADYTRQIELCWELAEEFIAWIKTDDAIAPDDLLEAQQDRNYMHAERDDALAEVERLEAEVKRLKEEAAAKP